MKRLYMFLMFYSNFAIAQVEQPKLVVGIVVDQMRFDYINRYLNDYGDDGFKRLIYEGYNCTNTHFK